MKQYIMFYTLLFSLLSLNSCKKDLSSGTIPVDQKENKAPIPPFPFAWETADYMPTPPNLSILVPWGGNASKNYNTDMALDFKSADGWELVYNTFNTTALTSPSFFALYNRYRGLLRIYFYLFPFTPTPSTYINHGININGSATPHILNYIGQDIVDVNTKLRSTTGIQRYQVQSAGGWYIFQYEIAYDPTIASTPYGNLDFQWYAKSINVTEVSLSGAINGTIKGDITTPGSSPTIGSALTQVVKGAFETTGIGILTAVIDADSLGLTKDKAIKLQNTVADGLSSGIVKNIFSALFGGSSGSTQQVNLVLNAQISLAGTMTNSTGLATSNVVIPGLSGSQTAAGFVPGYNEPMGVFYLSAKPKINDVDVVSGNGVSIPGGYGAQGIPHTHTYSIDNSSFSVLFNPSVINSNSNGAHIENFVQELLLVENYQYTLLGVAYLNVNSDGTVEQVGDYKDVRVNLSYSTRYQSAYGNMIPFHQTHGRLGIRFVFDVVPNNGAPRVKMAKTFWADEVFL